MTLRVANDAALAHKFTACFELRLHQDDRFAFTVARPAKCRGHHRRQRNRPAARRRIDRSVRQPAAIARTIDRTIDRHAGESRLVRTGGRRGQRCERRGRIGIRVGGLRFESVIERGIAELSE